MSNEKECVNCKNYKKGVSYFKVYPCEDCIRYWEHKDLRDNYEPKE